MPRKKKDYIFTLKVKPKTLLEKYYGKQNEPDDEVFIEETPIPIYDLMHDTGKMSKRSIMFLDPRKSHVKYWVSMVDLSNDALPLSSTKPCWWCRSKFESRPIGCPIEYHPTSPIDSDLIQSKLKIDNLPTDSGTDYFVTEGIFCTFPCIKAYIYEELAKSKLGVYKNSLALLTYLYFKCFGEVVTIPTGCPWKTLIPWGGHLTPLEARSAVGRLEYTETVNIKRPYMYSSSIYIRETKI